MQSYEPDQFVGGEPVQRTEPSYFCPAWTLAGTRCRRRWSFIGCFLFFHRHWDEEKTRLKDGKKPSIRRAAFRTFGVEFALYGTIAFLVVSYVIISCHRPGGNWAKYGGKSQRRRTLFFDAALGQSPSVTDWIFFSSSKHFNVARWSTLDSTLDCVLRTFLGQCVGAKSKQPTGLSEELDLASKHSYTMLQVLLQKTDELP